MSRERDAVLRRRMFTQGLAGRKLSEPDAVVRLLLAVQSQEYAHGFWSLGMRTRDATRRIAGAHAQRPEAVRVLL